METPITSEMISQQTICGEPENHNQDHEFIEISNDNKLRQAQSKEQVTEIKQTRKKSNQCKEVYFYYFLPQKKTHTKHSIKQRVQQKVEKVTTPPPPL